MENEIKVYKTTKEECQKNIRGVCSGCGSVIEPYETVDNSGAPTFWAACVKCDRFDNGVSNAVYVTAKKLFDEGRRPNHGMDRPDGKDEYYKRWYESSQVSSLSMLVRDVIRIYSAPELLSTLEQFIELAEQDKLTYKELEEARKLIFRIKN